MLRLRLAAAGAAPPGAGGAGGVGGPESTVRVEVVEDGLLNAVCYWFTLDLGGGGQVSSAPPKRRDRPGSWRAGWRQAAVYLEEPLHVVRGESVRLAWRVSDEGIRFSAREESASPPLLRRRRSSWPSRRRSPARPTTSR